MEGETTHSHLNSDCGSHCGVKDGIVGHCNCPDCHNGSLAKATVQYSTTGKLLPKDFKGD